MKSKTFRWAVHITAVTLAMATDVLAQAPMPSQFSGVIHDYSPATTVTPMGPWEMRGQWTLTLKADSSAADFSAALTMELSDYTRNSSNVDTTSGATSRMQHTHHITIQGGTVTQIPTGGFEVSGPVTITKDGSPAPLKPSTLTVDIIGGTIVQFSNITLQFAGGATVHFGSQLIHGVVSPPPTGVTIAITGPGGATSPTNTFETVSSAVNLDASQSTSSNPGALSFAWTTAPGFPTIGIAGGNTATPSVQLPYPGIYQLILTVTDSTGATATATVTLQYA
jgi:hypothetical protein